MIRRRILKVKLSLQAAVLSQPLRKLQDRKKQAEMVRVYRELRLFLYRLDQLRHIRAAHAWGSGPDPHRQHTAAAAAAATAAGLSADWGDGFAGTEAKPLVVSSFGQMSAGGASEPATDAHSWPGRPRWSRRTPAQAKNPARSARRHPLLATTTVPQWSAPLSGASGLLRHCRQPRPMPNASASRCAPLGGCDAPPPGAASYFAINVGGRPAALCFACQGYMQVPSCWSS